MLFILLHYKQCVLLIYHIEMYTIHFFDQTFLKTWVSIEFYKFFKYVRKVNEQWCLFFFFCNVVNNYMFVFV